MWTLNTILKIWLLQSVKGNCWVQLNEEKLSHLQPTAVPQNLKIALINRYLCTGVTCAKPDTNTCLLNPQPAWVGIHGYISKHKGPLTYLTYVRIPTYLYMYWTGSCSRWKESSACWGLYFILKFYSWGWAWVILGPYTDNQVNIAYLAHITANQKWETVNRQLTAFQKLRDN